MPPEDLTNKRQERHLLSSSALKLQQPRCSIHFTLASIELTLTKAQIPFPYVTFLW